MGDEQHGATAQGLHQVVADHALGLVIEGGGGLIHDQHARLLQDGACDGDALPLAAGEAAAPLAHLGGIAGGQIHDEIVGGSDRGCLDDLIAAGFWIGEGDVFLHRAIKQHRILGNDADLAPQGIELHFGDIDTIHQHGAALWVVKASHQFGEGAFTRTARAHHSHKLALGNGERYILQQQR